LLVPESHTRNQFYLESLSMLRDILSAAGYEVRIGAMIESIDNQLTIDLLSGRSIVIEKLQRRDDKVGVDDFWPCCIVLNNDLSGGIPEMMDGISQTVMPAMHLGWANRLKSEHFRYYEQVVLDFADRFEFDPWLLTPWFDQCPEVDFMQKEGQDCIVRRAEALFARVKKKYQEYDIEHEPFLAVKADQGTYGMAVMMIRDPQELKQLNRKQRTRMSTTKGGVTVTKVIIQEGVYSFETAGKENVVAEPVIYMFGRNVIGGFYRVHQNRGPDENLNAPGMNFLPLPFAKPCDVPSDDCCEQTSQFYIYGMVARLAQLAAARELAAFEKS